MQLELTKAAVIDGIEYAINVLTRLQQMGVKIELDDFGTGQSRLAYLAPLPLNKIKINYSFVAR